MAAEPPVPERPRSTPRAIASLVVLALTSGALACGSAGTVQDPFGGDRGMKQVRIEVWNANWNDATLYAIRGGERRRIGRVGGKSEAEFVVSWATTARMRIEIDLLGGDSCVTRGMVVSPGDHLEIRVPSDLSMDPECVRRRSVSAAPPGLSPLPPPPKTAPARP